MTYGSKVLNSRVLQFLLKSKLIRSFVSKMALKGGYKMLEGQDFLVGIGAFVLRNATEKEEYKNVLRDFGEDIADRIPGNKIEPQLVKSMDYIEEGMLRKSE